MSDFTFDLQRFDGETVTIPAGETFTADGITYTAGEDGAVLTTTDDKVTGISSGAVVAKLTDNDSSPAITFDGATAFDFACSAGTSILDVPYIRVERTGATINYTGGSVYYSAEGISAAGSVSVTGTMANILPFTVTFDIPDAGMEITLDGNTNVSAPEAVKATLTFPESITTLLENLKPLIPVLLNVDQDTADKLYDVAVKLISNPITAELQGEHSWNQDEKRLTITDGSYLVMNLLDYSLNLAAQDGDIDGFNFFYQRTDDALNAGAKFTPSTDEKAQLQLNFTKDGTQLLNGLLNVAAGALNLDVVNASVSVEKDTTLTITQDDLSAEFTYNDAATVTYSADKDGLSHFTFSDGNGSVDIKLNTPSGSISANVEVNGALTVDTENQTVGMTKDTTATITIGSNVISLTATDDAGITIVPSSDGKWTITPGKDDGSLDFTIKHGDSTLSGNLEISGGPVELDLANRAVTVAAGTTATITQDKQVISITTTDDAGFKLSRDDDGKLLITPEDGDGSLDITVKYGDKTIFQNTVSINGALTFDLATQAVGLTAGSTITLSLYNRTIALTATADASFTISQDDDGKLILTPTEGDGSLDFTITRADNSTVSGNLEISGGSIVLDTANQSIGLLDDTIVNVTFGDYKVTVTAVGDATSALTVTDAGFTIKPTEGDGSLDISLSTTGGEISANLEILSGSLTFGGGNITVAKDTELQITFSEDYSVKFKATDDAGGKISLGADGITFAPNDDDGGLELSVTRDGETRAASLDVTGGSVTYKLDGSISLEKGTVVKNKFEDGNILTIEAKTDASGSITFAPDDGLTINPSTPDALTATLTTGDVEVVKVTSIDGSITYKGGLLTASDGTTAHIFYYFGWESELRTKGGTSSVQFTTDRTVYIANEGANFVIDYLDRTTAEIQNGIYSDIYATETSDAIELVSEGSIFNTNDDEQIITLEKAGNYTLNGMNVTTTEDGVQVTLSGYDTATFEADAPVKVSTTDGGKIFAVLPGEETISFSTKNLDNTAVTGAYEFDNTTKTLSAAEGTAITITRDDTVITFTASQDNSLSYKIEEGIYYFMPDGEISGKVSVARDGITTFAGDVTAGGVLSFNPAAGTCGLTGANSSHGDGTNSFVQLTTNDGYELKMATNDTTVVFIPTLSDGKIAVNFPNERKDELLFTLSKDGNTAFEDQLTISGTVGFDISTRELSLTQGTVVTLVGDGENALTITALDDAGGQLTFTDAGIRFAPNAGDGQLELNFVATDRKANLDVSAGALIFGADRNISLEKDTVVNLQWEDGTTLTLTASDTGGAIGFDSQGLKVSSDGELNIDLTTPTGVQTTLTELNGTIHYNAGKVLFDPDSTITATSTLGGQSVDLTLESEGTGGYIEISADGTRYVAGTDALSVTWSRDDLSSTFSINSGSVFIGHGVFQIAEGSDLSTDLKDLVPALYFTTTDAGEYTINGQTIETTAENISMTATDDYMTFVTSDDPVLYNGMNFAGAGNVSLSSSSGVVLGAGVEATGFGVDKSFILAEAGNVTADARIFELTEDVPTGISVTGAQDGFIFSRTNSAESEARFDDPDPANVGKIFTEEFFLTNDDAYRIQTDLLGLQKIIGVTAPSTLNATATFDGEPERTVFDAVTDNEGVFTVGEKNYSISGDDEVAIKTIFNESLAAVRGFESLSGTVAGDFTAHEVSINGSASAFRVYNDSLISISADEDGFEVAGLDPEDFLAPVATDTYIVNSTTINANAGDLIFGRSDGAQLFALNNDTIINGTESDDIIDNIGSNVSIYGHAGNDSLGNLGSGFVDGGDGDDSIDNYADDVTISGGAGDDSIVNEGDNVYLSGGDGDDTIYNHGDNIIIDGGAGDDSISNNSENVVFIHSGGDDTIEGFNETSVLQIDGETSTQTSGSDVIVTAGKDKITLVDAASLESVQIIGTEGSVIANIDNNRLITGTGGNDSILNIGDNVSIKAFGGDDTIDNYGEYAVIEGSEGADSISNNSPENTLTANGVSINAGAGNDTIRNVHAYYVTLEGGAGDDHISVVIGNQTKIDGGAGNDTILGEALTDSESNWAMGGYATINGGAGDDYINPIFSDSASIMGGRGNDTIINEGDDATINGGAGDDLISLHGASLTNDVIKYDVGGGNDSIFGFNETTELSITAGTVYETAVSGEDVLVTVGEYVLTLAGAASLSTVNIVNYKVPALNISNTTDGAQITGTELADTIANSGENVTVSGRSGNDSITSSGANGSLNGGAGNDTLENAGANSTVEGYYGDDYLTNSGDGVLVNGNYGNDTIINSGDNATLNPGSGNNSIVNTGANVLINFTGGTDSVWGFNETSSLQTTSGATSIRSGGNIVVTDGEDKIILVDAASVVAPNFDDGETVVLTKKGEQIVAGERVFSLVANVPTGVTLTGAQNGFTSAILTDDGELFEEEFTVKYDDSYNVSINGAGVQTVSGISAGAEVTSSATTDGEETENQIYVVTDGAGSFLLNDMAITASDAATIRLRPRAMAFAAEGMTYDGKTFAGTGNVTVGADVVALGASVSAAGFEIGDEFILAQAGTTTVDGRVFELTGNISEGATISVERDGYTFSHTITQKESSKNNLPSDYVGKVYSENIVVSGDDNYSLRADSFGLKKVRGITDGATINGGDTSVDGDTDDKYARGGQYLYIDTATEGAFTFGEKTYSISGDSSVELEADFNQSYAYVRGVQDLDGTISGNFDGDGFKVNGKKPILIAGDESIQVVGTESGTKIYGVSDGASVVYAGGVKEIHTDTEGTFTFGEYDNTVAVTVRGDDNVNFKLNALQYIEDIADVQGDLILSYTPNNLLVNGVGGTFDGEFSSIGAYDQMYIHDVTDGSKFTTADADKIWLQMTGEHFTLNNNALTLTNDADGIWIRDKEIVGLDAQASLQVTAGGNYLVNETELKAKAGSVIIGESNGAHIYDARYPYLTKDTAHDELIEVFKPENTYTPDGGASLTLTGGDLAIVDAAKVNISAGDRATVVNRGEDVNVSLTGGNTWLFAQGGSMNLTGYDHTTGTGFGTNKQNILTAVADGKIDFNRGRLTLGDAEVFFPENSALMNFFNLYGKQYKVGFASQGEALDVSNVADDLILVAKRNGSITSGTGDDTILASADSFVDAGAGNNLIKSDGANVALSGRTTVEGTVDTVYIAGAAPSVDFKSGGLSLYYDDDLSKALTFSDITSTEKLNLYYAAENKSVSEVFIADDEWYKVSDGAADYYVGATAKKNHGLDFSGVSEPLDITMNTDYASTTAEFFVNNIHSLRGGDGLTTITGSERDDTILAGTGATTINAGKGFDKLYGNTGADKNPATFVYAAGDGQDSIANFDFMSGRSDVTADKVQLDEASGVTDVMLRGSDVMIKVNDADGFLMLEGARGQSFQLNDDLIAKVDTDVAFDGFTNCYVGIGERATLTVGKGLGDVEVWLSDDKLEYHGTMYDGNFKVVDASQSDGANILAGNELRNTIIGGAGNNSLWGGYGGENDLLIAGTGHNEYYYEVGNGHDTIAGANEGDVIHLGATLEQIDFDGTNMSADGITVKFTDGGQLDITGEASVSFSFDDGTTVKANRQTQQFE